MCLLRTVLLLSLLVMAGCVTTSDMETQKVNLSQMQGRVAAHDADIAQIKEKMGELTAVRDSHSSLLSQTSEYAKDLQSLRGRFEENRYYLDKTIKDLTTELELQRARIASLEAQAAGKTAPLPAAPTAPAAKAPEAKAGDTGKPPAETKAETKTEPAGDPRTLYDDAHIALKEKNYDDARAKFQKFIRDYPQDPLVPNCHYWIGETYYSEKKYEDAILAYDKFLQGYAKHDKARAALLKQGYSFLELGDVKTGKTILQMVVEKYPKTAEAELAQKKLDNITPKPAATKKSKPADKKRR